MTGKRKTILVVDDVPDDIVILEEILKEEYQVKAVTNGEAALVVARGDNPPDLILLDVMMPDMDGFEVCRRLKEDFERTMIPVIFLTARVMTEDEKLGFELGAVDYIRKPVNPEIVRARIRSYLEQKDMALRVSEVRYRRLFETAQDGIMIVDTQTGGVVDVNPSLAALMGLSQEAFLGKRISDLEFLSTILSQQKNLSETQKRNYIRYKDLPLATFDGRQVYIEFISNTYPVNHREMMQINIREITDLVGAERERDEFSARLSHYLSTSPTVTYSMVLKDGAARMRWVSENIRGLLGYTPEEALTPDWWFRNVNASDRTKALGIISDLTKREVTSGDYRFTKKDRSVVWIHDEMRLLPGKGPESEIVGTYTDISERKMAEAEIHLKSAALEAAANAVVITDRDGVIRWANPAFSALTGYSSSESIGKNPRDLIRSGRQSSDFYREIWDTILEGKVWSGTLVNRKKSGDLYTEEMTITPVFDESRYVSNFIAIKRDITESVLARERLESALRQREELLREIHHRVNNNIQVIISLLGISSQGVKDSVLRGKFEDIIRRMHVMALIHEQFYETENLSRIDFAAYLAQLIEGSRVEFPETSKNVALECAPSNVFLSLEQAIPAGLIVSELLTNALKFAFPDGQEIGTIRISQSFLDDGRLQIEVRDDGSGFPKHLDPGSSQSLGMTMIRILAEQIGGDMEFQEKKGKGVTATLKFRIHPSAAKRPPSGREEERS